jgi:DNA-binding FrmR family transcriptional regulator
MIRDQSTGKRGTMTTGATNGDTTGDVGAGAPGGDVAAAAICGCGAHMEPDLRRPHGVDPDIRDRNLKRLRRIEGQVRGLQRMVEEDRYCPDIMTQLSSVHEALRGVGRELMRNHLKHCATSAIRDGDPDAAEGMYDELVDMMYRHAR